MTTSPHACLGRSCSTREGETGFSSNINSPQETHLSRVSCSPARTAEIHQKHEVKWHCIHIKKRRKHSCTRRRGAVLAMPGSADVLQHRADARAGRLPRSCAFLGASSSSSSREPAGTVPSTKERLQRAKAAASSPALSATEQPAERGTPNLGGV